MQTDGRTYEQICRATLHDTPGARVGLPWVQLPDDVLLYLRDTLQWVFAVDPSWKRPRRVHGLNCSGRTIVNDGGGAVLARVLTHWAELFACGPETELLSCGWTGTVGDYGTADDWSRRFVRVSRDELVAALRCIASFGEQAAAGHHLVLHFGI